MASSNRLSPDNVTNYHEFAAWFFRRPGLQEEERLLGAILGASERRQIEDVVLTVGFAQTTPATQLAAVAFLLFSGLGLTRSFSPQVACLADNPDESIRESFQTLCTSLYRQGLIPSLEEWAPVVSRQLRDTSHRIRATAFLYLWPYGRALGRRVLDDVIAAVRDANLLVRYRAIQALREMGTEAARGLQVVTDVIVSKVTENSLASQSVTGVSTDAHTGQPSSTDVSCIMDDTTVFHVAVEALISLDPESTTTAAILAPRLTLSLQERVFDICDTVPGGESLRAALLRLAGPANGPVPPCDLRWKGKTEKLEPQPYLLLELLWPGNPIQVEKAEIALGGGDEPEPTQQVKSALTRVNKALKKLGCGFKYKIRRSYISRSEV